MKTPRRPSTKVTPRSEPRMEPEPKAERKHARPGAGIKRARGLMQKRAR
jgi:hypothetical protein